MSDFEDPIVCSRQKRRFHFTHSNNSSNEIISVDNSSHIGSDINVDITREIISVDNSSHIGSDIIDDVEFPNTEQLEAKLNELDENSHMKRAWKKLMTHEEWPERFLNENYKPFRNATCAQLFFTYENSTNDLSRQNMNCFLSILKDLQARGLLAADEWIPSNATTIESWRKYFMVPLIGM